MYVYIHDWVTQSLLSHMGATLMLARWHSKGASKPNQRPLLLFSMLSGVSVLWPEKPMTLYYKSQFAWMSYKGQSSNTGVGSIQAHCVWHFAPVPQGTSGHTDHSTAFWPMLALYFSHPALQLIFSKAVVLVNKIQIVQQTFSRVSLPYHVANAEAISYFIPDEIFHMQLCVMSIVIVCYSKKQTNTQTKLNWIVGRISMKIWHYHTSHSKLNCTFLPDICQN